MKRLSVSIFVLLSFLFVANTNAQDIITVDPGYGTLNSAIDANGGNKIYKLQAGKWYGLNASILVISPISIIGETPSAGQMPAIIQTGTSSDGTIFANMFTVASNLTLKNVFIVNADLNENIAPGLIMQVAGGQVVMDSITVDPVGQVYFMLVNAANISTYITNSLIMRTGHTLNINDGFIFYNAGNYWDTLYVENNTFIDIPTCFYQGSIATGRENFMWFNHNSLLFGKANLMHQYFTNQLFFTNNLMWNFDFNPYHSAWTAFWSDAGPKYKVECLINADTLVTGTDSTTGVITYESFPVSRKHFIEYNSNYVSQGSKDLVAWAKTNGYSYSYIMPLVWSPEYKDSSREASIFNDDVNFPYFKAGNNLEEANYDPAFTDSKIYTLTDSAMLWASYSDKSLWGLTDIPSADKWPNYFYNVDGNNGNPLTWPRFNGVYTNSTLLTASIENLPLGDLNWFPEAKALWAANKTNVMNHILATNETKYSLTDVEKVEIVPGKFQLLQNYPNPFNPSTIIKYNIPASASVELKIYNSLGQELSSLVNKQQNAGTYEVKFDASKYASGIYFYKIKAGSFVETKKMILVK